jgi:hypothetical protein
MPTPQITHPELHDAVSALTNAAESSAEPSLIFWSTLSRPKAATTNTSNMSLRTSRSSSISRMSRSIPGSPRPAKGRHRPALDLALTRVASGFRSSGFTGKTTRHNVTQGNSAPPRFLVLKTYFFNTKTIR